MSTMHHTGNQPGLPLESYEGVWFGLLTDEDKMPHKKNIKLAAIEKRKWKVLKPVPNHRSVLDTDYVEW